MIIDILFGLFMLWAIFNGYSNGLIIGLFSLVALLAGLIIALKFTQVCTVYGSGHFHLTGGWWPVVFFILLFVLVVLVVRLGARLLTKLIELALLGWLNRLCGIILYICIYTVIFSILLWIADRVHLISPHEKATSWVYAHIVFVGPSVVSLIGDHIPHFRHLLDNLADLFRRMARKPV